MDLRKEFSRRGELMVTTRTRTFALRGRAKVIVFDTRLSNTATHADHFIAPYPGSEAAILLAIANYLIQNDLYNREFVRRWWNWQEYLEQTSEVGGQRSEVDREP